RARRQESPQDVLDNRRRPERLPVGARLGAFAQGEDRSDPPRPQDPLSSLGFSCLPDARGLDGTRDGLLGGSGRADARSSTDARRLCPRDGEELRRIRRAAVADRPRLARRLGRHPPASAGTPPPRAGPASGLRLAAARNPAFGWEAATAGNLEALEQGRRVTPGKLRRRNEVV